MMNDGCGLEVRAAAEMAVVDLGPHFVVIATFTGFCVVRVEIFTVAKHRVCVTDVPFAETTASHCLAHLFRCVEASFTEHVERAPVQAAERSIEWRNIFESCES